MAILDKGVWGCLIKKRSNLLLGWNMLLNKSEINLNNYPEKEHHLSSQNNNELFS